MKHIRKSILSVFIFLIGFFAAADNSVKGSGENLLEVQAVVVDGKPATITGGKVDLGLFPKTISFNFGPPANTGRAPIRLRYKMDGYDNVWQQVGGEMNLTIRFYNDAGDQVNQSIFTVSGDSPGWNGSLKTSLLTHRRETVVVPPMASRRASKSRLTEFCCSAC